MPELPEVETVKNYLNQRVLNSQILSYQQYRDNIRYKIPEEIAANVSNSKISRIERRAKFINIFLDNEYVLTFHLGMTGRLLVRDQQSAHQKHDHIILNLSQQQQLVFNDARRFGMMYGCWFRDLHQQKFMQNIGVEPLSENFTADYLLRSVENISSPIKNHLMNNKVLVGVGNIYASESLFQARINPTKKASTINLQQAKLLVKSIKDILLGAIESGGTTLRDFVNGDNKPGYFQQKLLVYGKEHKPCSVCASKIVKLKQAGRSSFYCAQCQSL